MNPPYRRVALLLALLLLLSLALTLCYVAWLRPDLPYPWQ